jgi:fluoride exporter
MRKDPRMPFVILVFIGGGLGAVLRWLLAMWLQSHAFFGMVSATHAPWLSTLIINTIGGLCMGIAAGVLTQITEPLRTPAMLFFMTGVLGGFTTFSAFGLDLVHLLQQNAFGIAVGYAVTSVLFTVIGVAFGLKMTHF